MPFPYWLRCLAWIAIATAPAWADSDLREGDAALVAQLGDADLSVAGQAAKLLGERGASAFPMIRELLASGSVQQRWGATVALYRSTADPAPFLPELTRQLSQQDVRLEQASLAALARLESRAAPALPALKALLTHQEPEIRRVTLATFAAIGPEAQGSVPEIMPLLQDESAAIRLAAADAIRRIQPPVPLSEDRLAEYVAWLEHAGARADARDLHVPGISVAIMQRGEVVWAQGFGVRDVRSGEAVTTDTVFEACSMSKPVLALIAMQLVQEGRLDLDTPLVAYLGHDYLPDQPDHRRITARMALAHRTGLAELARGLRRDGRSVGVAFPAGVGIHVLGRRHPVPATGPGGDHRPAARSPGAGAPVRAAGPYPHELRLDGSDRARSRERPSRRRQLQGADALPQAPTPRTPSTRRRSSTRG